MRGARRSWASVPGEDDWWPSDAAFSICDMILRRASISLRSAFFPLAVMETQVRGRLSKPELIMSSNPGIYSQGQLLGFLLGGEPTGDPQAGGARDKVTGAGATFISNKIGGYVRNALPVDIDVLKYEAASAGTSAAVTVGTWLSRSLFVAYRRHLEARPDENTGEGEAEYWLSRRVMVEAVVGDRGYNGIDLLWRKRY